MIRIFGLLVLASTICLTQYANAQDVPSSAIEPGVAPTAHSGSAVVQAEVSDAQPGVAASHHGISNAQPAFHNTPQPTVRPFRLFRRGNQYRSRFASKEDRINHMKHELYTQRYPKFYGGFHSSHFSNIGVPSGGIGFRGNGIYWAPWQ